MEKEKEKEMEKEKEKEKKKKKKKVKVIKRYEMWKKKCPPNQDSRTR